MIHEIFNLMISTSLAAGTPAMDVIPVGGLHIKEPALEERASAFPSDIKESFDINNDGIDDGYFEKSSKGIKVKLDYDGDNKPDISFETKKRDDGYSAIIKGPIDLSCYFTKNFKPRRVVKRDNEGTIYLYDYSFVEENKPFKYKETQYYYLISKIIEEVLKVVYAHDNNMNKPLPPMKEKKDSLYKSPQNKMGITPDNKQYQYNRKLPMMK